jgi:DNA-binding SARP family transcriptional activator/ketosteroid isomerase-like protein
VVNLRVCGGVEVEVDGHVLPESLLGGRQGRLVLAYLACARDRAVRREELAELLWGEQVPESWTASLSAVISRLRRLFTEAGFDGPAVVVSTPGAYQLALPSGSRVDLEDLVTAVAEAEDAADQGDAERAVAAAARSETVASRGFLADDCEWVDVQREAVRDLRVRALLAQSAAHLGAGASGRAIEAARRAVELDETKEAAYRQLMLGLAAAGERAEALRVWERCRITLVEELGIDPSPETEAVYLSLLDSSPTAAPAGPAVTTELPSGVVTFLLTDIVESSALWEEHATAMATALERHDALVEAVVATHRGTLLKSKLEGDATISVFARATECATAALALLDAIESEPWPERARPRLRMAMHTGEAFERGGDYFGPALNRAARLRGLASANEVLLSQAVAELVRDHLPKEVVLRDRGLQNLRGLSRGEHVFELARSRAEPQVAEAPVAVSLVGDLERPPIPAALAATGPFVGRGDELEQLTRLWTGATAGEAAAVFVGGEPGVGKSRLAGEIAGHVHTSGGLVLYGRCDEDLAAPLQPFIEAVRVLAPALGAERLRAVRGVEVLTRVVPELARMLGEQTAVDADPDAERLALFDAVTQLLVATSSEVPVLLVLDDLHWAGKTTLTLLRHLLRGTRGSRLLVVGTYRDTELARTHPLAETLADLRRDTGTHRVSLGGLDSDGVAAYLAAIGNTDRALGRELAEVTAGNPFFLIEVVRHVEESGGSWQRGSLPEGVREATGRRLSRLSDAANEALSVAAVVGASFDLALVEQVRGEELVDAIAEAVQAGLVVEESGAFARFRFAHAIVRQVLLSELVSLKRVRLHRAIAELLEAAPPAADADARLADLAYHWYECASAGSADRAVEACRQAADRAMERFAYEEAGDLYGMALQALEWVDGADPEVGAALHLARCDALLTAGDVAGARDAIDALEGAAAGSERLAAWYTTYEGLLAVLGEPDRLTEIVQSIGAAAGAMRDVGDLTGEAKARYVHASALERLGQIGAAERALDAALAAARSAGDRRLADAILAEAPPAALWGPSPVTRASGRCLDVVRVLRITSGTPAVEAVALRCQAVLEALRGRMDAARRMIGSSRRTVEQLGLAHRRLEAELAAGLIELLDGQAEVAEVHLRDAYQGLRERGLGGEAAQAAAFLGRALLLQDRVDEADEVAADAETLAGSDLKAAITWRSVRAEAAVARGETDRALAVAREAVELASSTDALLLEANARLTLAVVLRASGDDAAADAEARRAVEACEAKGATTMADLARGSMSARATAAVGREGVGVTAASTPLTDNLAMVAGRNFADAFNRGDWDAVRANRTSTQRVDDRRPVVGMSLQVVTDQQSQEIHKGGGRFEQPELVATRGEQLACSRWLLRGPGIEVPFLALTRVDDIGLLDEFVMFEPEAMDDAIAALDDMAARTAFENDATRAVARVRAGFAARDWEMVETTLRPDWVQDDRRSVVAVPLDPEQSMASMRFIFDGGGQIDAFDLVATRGRSLVLYRTRWRVPEFDTTADVLQVSEVDATGHSGRTVLFDIEDIEGAYAELDRLFLEGEGSEHADVHLLGMSLLDALARLDTEAVGDLLAPDFRLQDHRNVGLPVLTRDEWLASFADVGDIYLSGRDQGRMWVEHLTDLSEHGALVLVSATGWLADGGPWGVRLLVVLHVAHDRVSGLEFFDERDVDAARTALVPRSGAAAAGPAPNLAFTAELHFAEAFNRGDLTAATAFENDAVRIQARTRALNQVGDWDGSAACYSDEWTLDDRRAGVNLELDPEQSRASTEMIVKGRPRFEWEPIATRGRSMALDRWTLHVRDPEATDTVLTVNRTDAVGRYLQTVLFDADELDTAYAELDRQYLEHEGAEHADVIGVVSSLLDALGRQDVDAAAALLAPGARFREHTFVRGAGSGEAEEFLRNLAETNALYGGRGAPRLHHVLDLASDGGVWAVRYRGDLADGGEFETSLLVAVRLSNGRCAAIDLFDEHDVDAARALLAAHRRPRSEPFENDAVRAQQGVADGLNAHDWDAVAAWLADDWVAEERRAVLRVSLDHDQAVANLRWIHDGRGVMTFEVVATRGRSLALARVTLRVPDPEASDLVLVLTRTNAAGRQDRTVMFDVDDVDVAIAEMDRLYREGEAAEHDEPIRLVSAWLTAIAGHDVAGVVATLAPDFVIASRRRYRPSQAQGVTEFLAGLEPQFEGYEPGTVRIDHVTDLESEGGLWRVVFSGDVEHGGSYELPMLIAARVAGDRIVRIDAFDEDDVDAARAVLEASPPRRTDWFENDATRSFERFSAAFEARDWDAVARNMADVTDDRRPLVGLTLDGQQAVENMRILLDGGGSLRYETIATRGRSLALARTTMFNSGALAGDTVFVVTRADDTGHRRQSILFDADDLDAALAELDRLFLEGEGAEHAEALTLGSTLVDAMDRQDTSAMRALLGPDFVSRSHRDLGLADADAEQFLHSVDVSIEVMSTGAARVDHVTRLTDEGGLWAVTVTGEQGEGGPFEISYLLAVRVAGGLITALDIYDERDAEVALASLESAVSSTAAWFENDATRAVTRVHHAYNTHDWNVLQTIHSSEWRQDDRRSVVAVPLDHEQAMAGVRWIFDGHAVFEGRVTLATRGDRLAAYRVTLRVPDPPATFPVLVIAAVDDRGQLLHSTLFDVDDLGGALAELDRLFVEGEGADHTDVLCLMASLFDALLRRDRHGVAALLAPDFVVRSHRTIRPLDAMTAAEWLDGLQAQFAGPAYSGTSAVQVDHVARLSARGGLWAVQFVGELENGGRFSQPVLFAVHVDRGRIAAIDAYDEHDGEAALGSLADEPEPNTATRTVRRAVAALNRRDWQGFVDAHAPAFVFVDDRPGVRLREEGDDAFGTYEMMVGLDEFRFERTPIAMRGDGLVLIHSRVWWVVGEAGPSDIETVSVVECDADGLIVSDTGFDPDDIDAAYALLEARHAELIGNDTETPEATPVENAAWMAALRVRDALHRRDWDGFVALLDPDVECVDHNGQLHLEGDDALGTYRILMTLEEFRFERTLLASRGDRLAFVRDVVTFRDRDSGFAEVEALSLYQVDQQGLVTHIVGYSPDDVDAAQAELDARARELNARAASLDADPLAIPRNRAARAVEQPGWSLLSALDEDLCLHETPDGFVFHEVDSTGAVVERVAYSSDDLAGAASEIARRFYEHHGVPVAVAATTASINEHDLVAVRRCLDDDCVFEDSREFRVVEIRDADQYVETLRSAIELAPDYTIILRRVLAVAEFGHVLLTGSVGTTIDGGSFEVAVVAVSMWDERGLVSRIAIYEPKDAALAVRHLHDLLRSGRS